MYNTTCKSQLKLDHLENLILGLKKILFWLFKKINLYHIHLNKITNSILVS